MTGPEREASVEERLYYRDIHSQLAAVCRLLLKAVDDTGSMSMRVKDPACERAAALCDRLVEIEKELRAEGRAFRLLSEARADVTEHGGQVT